MFSKIEVYILTVIDFPIGPNANLLELYYKLTSVMFSMSRPIKKKMFSMSRIFSLTNAPLRIHHLTLTRVQTFIQGSDTSQASRIYIRREQQGDATLPNTDQPKTRADNQRKKDQATTNNGDPQNGQKTTLNPRDKETSFICMRKLRGKSQ